jgi:Ca-activated chloride channel family protein
MGQADWQWLWPQVFWGMLLLPLVVWLWMDLETQRLKRALRFSPIEALRLAKLAPSRWKRMSTLFLLLMMVVCLLMAAARPYQKIWIPNRTIDLMLVMDISLSMMADDVKPNRLTSAKEAARHFVDSLPEEVRVGLTLFAGNTYLVSPVTKDHRSVSADLHSLNTSDLQPRTEMGSAMQVALKSLAEPQSLDQKNTKSAKIPPLKVMLLMSDGDSHEGYPWRQAVLNSRKQRVVVHTVGIGTDETVSIRYKNQVLPVQFSEQTLKAIAEGTGGKYFRVFRGEDFQSVYDWIGDRALSFEEKKEDRGWIFVILALGLGFLALVLERFWVRRS